MMYVLDADACYVALAYELDAPLITADLKLIRQVQGTIDVQPLLPVQ